MYVRLGRALSKAWNLATVLVEWPNGATNRYSRGSTNLLVLTRLAVWDTVLNKAWLSVELVFAVVDFVKV
jgi:hypothetical protein